MTAPRWTSFRAGEAHPGPGVTVYRLAGSDPGPRLLTLGGVHGNEIGGIVGAGRLTEMEIPLARGTLDVVPVTHEAANDVFARESPLDGLNLARVFPGVPGGSPTQRVAAVVAGLISGADGLIDIHTSSPDAEMPLFAGSLSDGTPHADRGVQMAAVFGAGTVWTHPWNGPGRTISFAQEQQIPAMYCESPAGGVLDEAVLSVYTSGVLRVCALLGMLPAAAVPPGRPPQVWLDGNGDNDTITAAPCAGYFLAETDLLRPASRGSRIGRMIDEHGRTLAEITAPDDGVVTFLRRQARVSAGESLVSVSQQHPIENFPWPLPEWAAARPFEQ